MQFQPDIALLKTILEDTHLFMALFVHRRPLCRIA